MSTSKYAITACLLAVITLNNHANATWQVEPQEQARRDNDRFSILNRELANEKNLLIKNKDKLNKAISANSPEQIKEFEISIKRTEGNIDALNKELGINNRISANTNLNTKSAQVFNLPTVGKNNPLPASVVNNQSIDIPPTIKTNPNIQVKANQKLPAKNNLIKFRGKLISPALAQLYDSSL